VDILREAVVPADIPREAAVERAVILPEAAVVLAAILPEAVVAADEEAVSLQEAVVVAVQEVS
jgi:hypothetical protein